MRVASIDILALAGTVASVSNVLPTILGSAVALLGSIYYGMQILDWLEMHRAKKALADTRQSVRDWHREDQPHDGPNLP